MPLFAGLEHIVRENEPLAPYTWFRLGGAAQYFAEPTTVEELAALVQRSFREGLPVRVLGGGSNVLVRDEGVAGLVVSLSAAAFGQIRVAGSSIVVGGGAKLGHVISTAVREGLAGLQMLVGIPGTVGGALRTNASAYSSDIGQYTARATVMTRQGQMVVCPREALRFGYRQSSLDELAILEAQFDLERGDPAYLTKQMQQAWILKRAQQPLLDQPAGMIFKSPGGVSVGDAWVCERNPNFIVVGPRAKSRDVLELIEQVRSGVAQRMGVELELALEVW
jgi:UDP-N-acetylmuramate dehydrogenase